MKIGANGALLPHSSSRQNENLTSRVASSVDLPKRCCREQPMLIERLQHLARHRAKPSGRRLTPHSGSRLAHRHDVLIEKMSARTNRPDCR